MFWYEDEIKRLEKERVRRNWQPETLFYGSSSIRLWISLADDFHGLGAANLGFGGSTLAACTWYFERVMSGYSPKRMIFYAGDNDLGDGRHPEEVFIFFQELAARVNKRFGPLPCYFISLKPSISRWGIADRFHFTNKIIADEIKNYWPNWQFVDIYGAMLKLNGYPNAAYYLADGLHLSEKGYTLWKDILQKAITT